MTKRAIVLLLVLLLLVAYEAWSRLHVAPLPAPDRTIQVAFPNFIVPPPIKHYTPPGPGQPVLTSLGHWYQGSAGSYFTPCGSSVRYPMEATPSSMLNALSWRYLNVQSDTKPLFVRGAFYFSRLGRSGQPGPFARQAVFTRILEVRLPTATDCEGTRTD